MEIAEHVATKISCQCGLNHSLGGKAKHLKPQEHLDIIQFPNGFKFENSNNQYFMLKVG